MPNKLRIFLAGVSGETGKRVLHNLIAAHQVQEIHLFVRRTLPVSDPRVHQHIVEFENLNKLRINNPENLETLSICTLGSTIKKAGSKDAFRKVDSEYVCNFAAFSIENSCEQFAVISSVGADKNSQSFYLKVKGDMEYQIAGMTFKSIWIFRPSLLTGKRKEFRLAEKLSEHLSKLLSPLLIGPLRKYRPIKMSTVASALSGLGNQNPDVDEPRVNILEGRQIEDLAKAYEAKLKQI